VGQPDHIVVAQLLQAYPEFADNWSRFRKSDRFGPGEPYNHLGQLADHLVGAMIAGDTQGFDQLFGEVEKLLAGAPAATRDLLIVGLLEDIQNLSMNRNVELEHWEPWLRVNTKQAWQMLRSLWAGQVTPEAFNQFVKLGQLPAPAADSSAQP
jgi:hypothetical protein